MLQAPNSADHMYFHSADLDNDHAVKQNSKDTAGVPFTGVRDLAAGSASSSPDRIDDLKGVPLSRPLGHTERNWCRALDSGTGHTVVGLLFRAVLDVPSLQAAVAEMQGSHPRLRSCLVYVGGRPAFQVSPDPNVHVEVKEWWPQPPHSNGDSTTDPERSLDHGSLDKDMQGPRQQTEVHKVDQEEEENEFHDAIDDLLLGDEEEFAGVIGLTEAASKVAAKGLEGSTDEEGVTEGAFRLLGSGKSFKLSMCKQRWLRIVEAEMNMHWEPCPDDAPPVPKEDRPPVNLLQVRLYRLVAGRSLVILKAHTAICDRASAAIMTSSFLAAMARQREGAQAPPPAQPTSPLLSVEACVPRKQAKKPFWAHGVDVVGYGLGSRRHAVLPFQDAQAPRHTQLIRSGLNSTDTDALLQRCEREGVCLAAALSAAAMAAAAAEKQLGSRQEHYCITNFLDCRPLLDPPLSDSTIGFYHSAMLNTHHVGEGEPFWDLARRCQRSVDDSVKHRKHFTDMGDLNMLMKQAMEHPNLTPASSLRTSMLSIFWSPLHETMQDYSERLHVEDYVGCSSVHGVGPCLGIFDSVREDGLHIANVYAAPLFSRSQMKLLVSRMMRILKASSI